MAIVTPEELRACLPGDKRLLGLDLGAKTIGLAVSDERLSIASPLETLKRGKFTATAQALAALAERERIGGLVIGLPISMDGSEGPQAQSARQFGRNLLEHLKLPIVFWDERLSTVAVERVLLAADASRKRRGQVVDKMAAAYILQGLLDRYAAT